MIILRSIQLWSRRTNHVFPALIVGANLLLLFGCTSLSSSPLDNSEIVASIEVFQDCDECPEMVAVGPGTFTMGRESGYTLNDAVPVHDVTIDYRFAVGRFEVTYGEWLVCVADNGCKAIDPDQNEHMNYPATSVSWFDAQDYIAWLSSRTGHQYRLLSEAEWEFSVRAGTLTRHYNGNHPRRLCEIANIGDRSLGRQYRANGDSWWQVNVVRCDDHYAGIAPVGSYRPNNFGLYDMIGNVWEWTQDCYTPNYQNAPVDGSAQVQSNCEQRIARGGSNIHYYGIFWRFHAAPTYRSAYEGFGFRVARDLDL